MPLPMYHGPLLTAHAIGTAQAAHLMLVFDLSVTNPHRLRGATLEYGVVIDSVMPNTVLSKAAIFEEVGRYGAAIAALSNHLLYSGIRELPKLYEDYLSSLPTGDQL